MKHVSAKRYLPTDPMEKLKSTAIDNPTLEIADMKLTSYVSRHTMAITLQDNQIPRSHITDIGP